jgi:hypothetical protein
VTYRTVLSLACTALFALAGCAKQQQAAEPAPEPTIVYASGISGAPGGDPNPQPPAPQPPPQPKSEPQPQPPAPTFPFPADLTGRGLARVVVPDVSRPLAVERFGAAPKQRAVPAQVLDPDAAVRANHVPPPVPASKSAATKPAPPAEKVPIDLGAGADGVPTKPTLPVATVVTERARDVNLPPPAPVLGRPVVDRVSLDDPTNELGNAEVVAGAVKTPLAPSAFQKVTIPDPFELAEQVKPKVPAVAEPAPAPVPVNPQRVK